MPPTTEEESKAPYILRKLEEYVALRETIDKAKREASDAQNDLDLVIQDIHHWLNTFPESKKPKNLPIENLGTFTPTIRTFWSVSDPVAFEAWRHEKDIPFETFYAPNANKLSTFCNEADKIDAELPEGVKSYDKERISWRRS